METGGEKGPKSARNLLHIFLKLESDFVVLFQLWTRQEESQSINSFEKR